MNNHMCLRRNLYNICKYSFLDCAFTKSSKKNTNICVGFNLLFAVSGISPVSQEKHFVNDLYPTNLPK